MTELLTENELLALSKGDVFLFDVESFNNYFLAAFKHYSTGKVVYFEAIDESPILYGWIEWMLDRFCNVGFNSNAYDIPILSYAATGTASPLTLKQATNAIIIQKLRISEVEKEFCFNTIFCNTIDLIEVLPLTGSLKTYAARLHCQHLQDLPFDPDATLTSEQIAIVRTYCFSDLDNTALLLREVSQHLELRAALSLEFGKDFRSKSDAQLAQEIVNTEIKRISKKYPKKIDFSQIVDTSFTYNAPAYICFQSKEYSQMLKEICASEITVGQTGHVICPKSIEGRKFVIAGKHYAIGMGGLHSQEKTQAFKSGKFRILDRDVTGYYPNLILKNGFAPPHLGQAFLDALQSIVNKRYKAKKSNDKVTADSLKIASNGTFGKLSDPYSTLYSPKMMVQTTLTGQLSLLMQIENLELNGFRVISANTDGIVTLCEPDRYQHFCALWAAWEQHTNLETEETEYASIYARDVNNYIAFKLDGKHKEKGVYSALGSALNSPLSKNPDARICVEAAIAHIAYGKPIIDSLMECDDICKFVIVKKVTGGAQKDGRYLGKTVRWYFAKKIIGSIIYVKDGNKVGNSNGGKPCMLLPRALPKDIDYERYEAMTVEILEDINFQKKANQQLTLELG